MKRGKKLRARLEKRRAAARMAIAHNKNLNETNYHIPGSLRGKGK